MSPALARTQLRRLIDQGLAAGELSYFAPIADSPGFLDLVAGTIDELKRVEIWPDELARAQGSRPSLKDRELSLLYTRYQELLNRHQLFDREGQFWSAREQLRAGRWGPFALVRQVYVDGFADFTRTEHEVLELLAARAELLISLPLEPGDVRGDLFAKSRETLGELRRRHPNLIVDWAERRDGMPPALAHLERHLFGDYRQAVSAPDVRGLEIISAAGQTHEIELLAERIKQLLTEVDPAVGRPRWPEEILVVFRTLGEQADLVRATFARFGIPTVVNAAPSLGSAPLLAALLNWLHLDQDDWPFRQLLSVLTHNYFAPKWREWKEGRAALAAERLARGCALSEGRNELLLQIDRLANSDAESSEASDARLALPLLTRMAAVLDELPRRATLSQWAAALEKLATSTGMLDSAERSPLGSVAADSDRLAWQQTLQALAASDRMAEWMNEPPEVFDGPKFVEQLEDLYRSESQPLAADEPGAVRVLSAESARNLSAPIVFLAQLTEKSFPPTGRDNCLHSESDAQRLIARGLPLVSQTQRSKFELLLFYEMVTRATQHLVLSYPGLDPAAQPLSPSPYLMEVEHALATHEIRRTVHARPAAVPASNLAHSPRDWRVRAVAQALEGDSDLLVQLRASDTTRATADNVLAALVTSDLRRPHGADNGYGPFEGMFSSEAARSELAKRFGPAHCWSPSQLEQYANCPYKFFLQSVLKLQPPGEPALETDHRNRGSVLHWVLSKCPSANQFASGRHRRCRHCGQRRVSRTDRRPGRPTPPISSAGREPERRHARARPAAGVQLAGGLLPAARGLRAAARERLRADAPGALRGIVWAATRGGAAQAAEQGLPDDHDPLSRLEAFELDCQGETIRFAGRIDRVDLGQVGGQTVFSILDYKSGQGSLRTRLDSVFQGLALQLPIYALAAEWLLNELNAVGYRAAYWHIGGDGFQLKQALAFRQIQDQCLAMSDDWRELQQFLRHRVRALVAGIRVASSPCIAPIPNARDGASFARSAGLITPGPRANSGPHRRTLPTHRPLPMERSPEVPPHERRRDN